MSCVVVLNCTNKSMVHVNGFDEHILLYIPVIRKGLLCHMKNSALQFAQLRSQLISAFIFRSMDSRILLVFLYPKLQFS